jgi:hypothetical protein
MQKVADREFHRLITTTGSGSAARATVADGELWDLDMSDVRWLKMLEAENARLKKLLADAVRDAATLKELLARK